MKKVALINTLEIEYDFCCKERDLENFLRQPSCQYLGEGTIKDTQLDKIFKGQKHFFLELNKGK